jgi:hypothetical protein
VLIGKQPMLSMSLVCNSVQDGKYEIAPLLV